jgi:hypothetical protein
MRPKQCLESDRVLHNDRMAQFMNDDENVGHAEKKFA